MQLIARIRRHLSAEEGIALPAIMGMMLVLGLLTAGVITTVQADTPLARKDIDRKLAYSAAEAGAQNYMFRLQRDPEVWTQCTDVPGPAFVNQVWNGTGADPRAWRNLPGSKAQYTVELLPATGKTACSKADPGGTLIDGGLIRIRATGRSNGVKRSIIVKFRRRSFLDFLYFTDKETMDPAWYTRQTSGARTVPDIVDWARTNCTYWRDGRGDKTYSGKWFDSANVGHNFTSECGEIQFAPNDKLWGPVHTNDEMLICGHPKFGNTIDDAIEVSSDPPGWRSNCSSSSPTFTGTFSTNSPLMNMPPTNESLRDLTDPAYIFTGKTTIVLGAAQMTVNGTPMAYPSNGVVYVQNGACPDSYKPYDPYNVAAGCANVWVHGTSGQSITIASQNDIVIDDDITNANDSLVGLISNNFIRIYHPVKNRRNNGDDCDTDNGATPPKLGNVEIDAAMLALQHSIMVDNYYCGGALGTLTVNGAIIQQYRGPVGQGGSTITNGYVKDYHYDERLRYRQPPNFLDPVQSSWRQLTQTEQVPAR